ncbi:Dihydropteroate synthase [Ceraceosorus guamensis]|uniref:Dihydropteroate synthase n=1 Tax=Ceraceosorus guamensis TaxID=1522189 RepID=A0A316W1W6_9BASI|nr:Dihydropteroate synthase [Ceraceosorus guamensis]PWN43669.1 Dihydropteroate synthase [Ceraceosorus guamensis]
MSSQAVAAASSSADTSSSYPDRIIIEQLSLRAQVGVDAWGRRKFQPLLLDVSVHTDVSSAGRTDHLPFSIHYGILVKELETFTDGKAFASVDSLIEELAKVCIFICKAPRVTLTLEKPRALLHAAAAGLTISRTAADYAAPKSSPNASQVSAAELFTWPADKDQQASSRLRHSMTLLDCRDTSGWQDSIVIRRLNISTILGVNAWERVDRQVVTFDLDVKLATRADRLTRHQTMAPVDHRTLVDAVSKYVEKSDFQTVESLATEVARVVVVQLGYRRARVRVGKPSAITFAEAAGIEVDRDQEFFAHEAKLAGPRAEASSSNVESNTAQGSANDVAGSEPSPAETLLSASHHTRMSVAASTENAGGAGPSKLELVDNSVPITPRGAESVASDERWHMVAISLGSNLGNRALNIHKAIMELAKTSPDCKVIDTSFLYETKPLYFAEQPRFLNAACRVATRFGPHQLLQFTQSIETNLGRDKTGVPLKGPRVVDLDLVCYDELILDSANLKLPHPGVEEREFVLRPLADILPEYRLPTTSRTIRQTLNLLLKAVDYGGHGDVVRVLPLPPPSGKSSSGAPSQLEWEAKTYVMGILNATPDSFSDGGSHLAVQSALAAAQKMVEHGADILDIGGQSTAPQAAEISAQEEKDRVLPIISAIRRDGIAQPISIDTFRADVASAALDNGAQIINDVSGGMRDPAMLKLAADRGVPIILMHMRGDSKTMHQNTKYENENVTQGVIKELSQRVDAALRAGVPRWNIIADPGIGFAKDKDGNVALLRELHRLTAHDQQVVPKRDQPSNRARTLQGRQDAASEDLFSPNASLADLPVLVGASRKRFLGTITGQTDPKDRAFATAAVCTAAIAAGADIIRVHDVKEMVDVAKTADAIFRNPQPKSRSKS